MEQMPLIYAGSEPGGYARVTVPDGGAGLAVGGGVGGDGNVAAVGLQRADVHTAAAGRAADALLRRGGVRPAARPPGADGLRGGIGRDGGAGEHPNGRGQHGEDQNAEQQDEAFHGGRLLLLKLHLQHTSAAAVFFRQLTGGAIDKAAPSRYTETAM